MLSKTWRSSYQAVKFAYNTEMPKSFNAKVLTHKCAMHRNKEGASGVLITYIKENLFSPKIKVGYLFLLFLEV